MVIDFAKLQKDVAEMRQMVQLLLEQEITPENLQVPIERKKPLNVKEAAAFLDVSPQTVYQRIKDIPHRKRFGKLYFFEDELQEYIKKGI